MLAVALAAAALALALVLLLALGHQHNRIQALEAALDAIRVEGVRVVVENVIAAEPEADALHRARPAGRRPH